MSKRIQVSLLVVAVAAVLYPLAGFFLTPKIVQWLVIPKINEGLHGELRKKTGLMVTDGTISGEERFTFAPTRQPAEFKVDEGQVTIRPGDTLPVIETGGLTPAIRSRSRSARRAW